MRTQTAASTRLAGILSLTILAGCSGSTQIAPPATHSNPYLTTQTINGHVLQRSFSVLTAADQARFSQAAIQSEDAKPDNLMQPNTCLGPPNAPKIYVTRYASNSVRVFRQAPLVPDGVITGLSNPQGIDVHGNRVYVANSGGPHNIRTFTQCGTPAGSMPDAPGYPSGVAVDTAGNVYVANSIDVGAAPGEVRYYAGGTGPGITIGDPNLAKDFFVTVDIAGDVFVDGIATSGAPEIDWCQNSSASPCNASGAVWTNTGIGFGYPNPGGLRIDSAGHLVLDDPAGKIGVYAVPGFANITTKPCPGNIVYGSGRCVDFGFNSAGTRLFVADTLNGKGWRIPYPAWTPTTPFGPGLTPASQPISAAAYPAPPWGG